MNVDAVLDFFGRNPWIVAASAVITLWPVLRSTFLTYRKLEGWVVKKVSPADHVAGFAKISASYLIAFLFTRAIYIFLLYMLLNAFEKTLSRIPISEQFNGAMAARYMVALLFINIPILIGLILGTIFRLCNEIMRMTEGEGKE